MVSLPGITPQQETVSPSQRRFSAIEPLDRLQATAAQPQIPALNFHAIPTTSFERCRASGAPASRDQDASLPEKIAAEEDKGHGMPEAYAEETVLYLAYGSNMAAQTFLGMRGIKPISKIPVLVPELRLTFDLPGLPYAEPCFAGTEFRDPDSIPEDTGDSESDFDVADEEKLLTESEYLSEKAPLVQTKEFSESKALQWNKPLVGVVYEVSLVDYAKIIATEGGGRGYRDVVVDCFPFAEDYTPTQPIPSRPSTEVFKAHTLLSPAADEARRRTQKDKKGESASCSSCSSILDIGVHMRPDPEYAQPSARYLGLLITGTTEHDLPVSYREYLSQIHTYKITTTRQKIGKFSFMALWGPPVITMLTLSKKFAGPDGRSPPWVVCIANIVVAGMWTSYDYFYKWVFGDGERTIGDTPSV